MTDEAVSARATLERAAAFLSVGLGMPERSSLGRGTARVVANSLRELDRFLNLLIDEAARGHGVPDAPKQRNTANKLRRFRATMGQPDGDYVRLRALGRTRECLFHSGGTVTKGDTLGIGSLTMGWHDPQGNGRLHRCRIGDRMQISTANLADVGRFYAHLAADLVPGKRVVSPPIADITTPAQPTISSGAKK